MIGKDPYTPDEAIPWRCFDLVYAARLLVDGYNFDEDHATIEFLGDVGGVEVEWTLGALLHTLLAAATVKLSARSSFADRMSALLLVGAGFVCFLYLRKRSTTRVYQPVSASAAFCRTYADALWHGLQLSVLANACAGDRRGQGGLTGSAGAGSLRGCTLPPLPPT